MTVIGENLDSVAQPLLEIMVSSASLNYSETFLAVSLLHSILPSYTIVKYYRYI